MTLVLSPARPRERRSVDRLSFSASATLAVCCVLFVGVRAHSQVLINEVKADNRTTMDIGGGTPDVVELYNASDETVLLGAASKEASYHLSDGCLDPAAMAPEMCEFVESGTANTAWRFPPGTAIEPGGFLVVFCDGDAVQGLCELHASFEIDDRGDEPIILWGPQDPITLERPIVDLVWLPPLGRDVSFGRFPDGAGGPNVALDDMFDFFVFSPSGQSSFGTCTMIAATCRGGGTARQRRCSGAPNGSGGPIAPEMDFILYSKNHPASNEGVALRVEVRDEKEPTAENLVRVEINYSVDGVPQPVVRMSLESSGDRTAEGRPLERFSIWSGEIPAQPAGSVVEFTFLAADVDGGLVEEPDDLCSQMEAEPGESPVVGPCDDIGLPGPDCRREADGMRFEACSAPYRYRVAHLPEGALADLVINEVVAIQNALLRDPSDDCNGDFCEFDDYIELFNGGDAALDLSGLWLSDRAFNPRGWPFPAGSSIGPGEHLVVWVDGDGGQCPRPDDFEEFEGDDGQMCPDPTDASIGSYHTNFRLSGDGERIYLFDRADAGFGLIHGLEFGPQQPNVAMALCPNGAPSGAFAEEIGTPGAVNSCASSGVTFRRGDANGDCTVNVADAVFLLRHLFQAGGDLACPDAGDANDDGGLNIADAAFALNALFGGGVQLPAPGSDCPGIDPTADELPACVSTGCAGCP